MHGVHWTRTPKRSTHKGADDNKKIEVLLEAANTASERVSGLHVAFMGLCLYVLVIVFGTKDLDLLIGKGVRLPIVDVEIPIVGFYLIAPYLVLLVHLNLLLQLQLLSRKLFDFDAVAQSHEGIGLRDRLHGFPYSYYLVGRPGPLVHAFWRAQSPHGSFALLMTLIVGPLLPLALQVDGEWLERMVAIAQGAPQSMTTFSKLLDEKRHLDLHEKVLLAKQPKPEILALIRSGGWQEVLNQLEPINLKARSLRHAQISKAILTGADLRCAQLQGADLSYANLQGVDWSCTKEFLGWENSGAQLQGALLIGAELQGADLTVAHLEGAVLIEAQLQGALLSSANLQGANLLGANLQGATLYESKLQGADLNDTVLTGADLEDAVLKGSSFGTVRLQGHAPEGCHVLWQQWLVQKNPYGPQGSEMGANFQRRG